MNETKAKAKRNLQLNSLPPTCCSLSQVSTGTAVRIKQISACPEISQRLREMGLCEEQQIKLLLKHTNLICQVCNMRVGISAQLADAILVEPLGKKSRFPA